MAATPENKPTLFIRNIPYSSTAEELSKAFEQFGAIERVKILKDRYHGQLYSRGIGFVEFKEQKSLDDALAQTEHNLGNRKLFIAKARPPRPKKHDTAFVRGIPEQTTVEQVKEVFAKYNPTNAKIIKFNSAERGLGFGFVQFASSEDQTKAVQENRTVTLNGAESRVSFARVEFDAPPRRNRRFSRRGYRRGQRRAPRQNQAKPNQ